MSRPVAARLLAAAPCPGAGHATTMWLS